MHEHIANQCSTAGIASGRIIGGAPDRNCEAAAQCSPEPTILATVEVRASRCFADALMHAMDGGKIMRAGWDGARQWVTSQWPDKGSKMSRPYLYLTNAQNELVPWVPSQGDLFAHDWAMLPR